MVFFNYATMQMAAKIVYYGPGLCGKTTNLHVIYGRTAPTSRGEMVCLETETDRTLFFDLLPLDVGVIGGFKTRVQLYTVPGQVFYNTTRKLVLKGVDGIVFVADSQRAMKDANVESIANLKTDLADILSLEELSESLNPERLFESYEACAVLGQGVFETLKAISRLTLRSLKKRMLGDDRGARVTAAPIPPEPAPPPPRPVPLREVPAPVIQPPPRPIELELEPEPEAIPFDVPTPPPPPTLLGVEAFDADDVETVNEVEDALNSLDAPLPDLDVPAEPVEIGEISFAEAPAAPQPTPLSEPPVKHVRVRSNIDILAELEKLRKSTTAETISADRAARRQTTGISIDDLLASSLNHRKEINRIFEVQVPQVELAQGRHVTIGLRIEDNEKNPVGEEKTFSIDLHTKQEIEKLLLSLQCHIFG